MKAVPIAVLVALLALPVSGRASEEPPPLRKHVLSAGLGATMAALGAKYTYRFHERGPSVSAGAGMAGFALELGVPIHRTGSRRRELFVYGGVLRWQYETGLDFSSNIPEGSNTWLIGIGPRLWPDGNNRGYVAGGAELLVSHPTDTWWSLSVEGGLGF